MARRLGLVIALVVLGLGACGDDDGGGGADALLSSENGMNDKCVCDGT